MYTRSGVVTVNFRHIQTFRQHQQQQQQLLTQRQQESIEKFNAYLNQHFYGQFVSEDSSIYKSVTGDESDRIAKAVVVPLKKDVLHQMEQGGGRFGDFAMDIDAGNLHVCLFLLKLEFMIDVRNILIYHYVVSLLKY